MTKIRKFVDQKAKISDKRYGSTTKKEGAIYSYEQKEIRESDIKASKKRVPEEMISKVVCFNPLTVVKVKKKNGIDLGKFADEIVNSMDLSKKLQ